jgi:hypothetical protein
VSDGASKQKLFGHRICDKCVGDGMTEEIYQEKMLDQSEERETERTVLQEKGEAQRDQIYIDQLAISGALRVYILHCVAVCGIYTEHSPGKRRWQDPRAEGAGAGAGRRFRYP